MPHAGLGCSDIPLPIILPGAAAALQSYAAAGRGFSKTARAGQRDTALPIHATRPAPTRLAPLALAREMPGLLLLNIRQYLLS